jgi:hypothetical protein
MSIFLEIAKLVILEKTTNIKNASKEADVSGLTQFRGFLSSSLKRDTVLSAKKRDCLTALESKISELPTTEDDHDTLKQLKILVSMCITDTTDAAMEKEHSRGETEPALESLSILLQTIFDKLESLSLLNIARDNDPLNIFRFFAADYYAKRIVKAHMPSLVSTVISHPSVLPTVTFEAQQEALVEASLISFARDVAAINTADPDYHGVKKRMLLGLMLNLAFENDELAAAHPLLRGLVSPDSGLLKTCLKNARAEMTAEINLVALKHAVVVPLPLGSPLATAPPAGEEGERSRAAGDGSTAVPLIAVEELPPPPAASDAISIAALVKGGGTFPPANGAGGTGKKNKKGGAGVPAAASVEGAKSGMA